MDAYAEIRSRLSAFAGGRMGISAFSDWLSPLSFDIESRGIPLAVQPLRRIVLHMAEYSLGHRSLRSFRAEVKAVLREFPATAEAPTMVREGTTEVAVKRESRRSARRASSKR